MYRKCGARSELFRVCYVILSTLVKLIKTDSVLTIDLWSTVTHDVCTLATTIMGPNDLTNLRIQSWVADLDNYIITDAFSK